MKKIKMRGKAPEELDYLVPTPTQLTHSQAP